MGCLPCYLAWVLYLGLPSMYPVLLGLGPAWHWQYPWADHQTTTPLLRTLLLCSGAINNKQTKTSNSFKFLHMIGVVYENLDIQVSRPAETGDLFWVDNSSRNLMPFPSNAYPFIWLGYSLHICISLLLWQLGHLSCVYYPWLLFPHNFGSA